jgi:hypothetical protein
MPAATLRALPIRLGTILYRLAIAGDDPPYDEVIRYNRTMRETEENAKHRLTRRPWFAAVLFFVAVVALLATWKRFGPGLPQISPADLDAAQKRWQAAGVHDYDLTVELAGRQTGKLQIQVRNDEPISLVRNGASLREPRTWQPWTVPGMFDTLTTDFENAAKPAEKYGSPDVRVVLRAEFDADLGYPKRYLQQVFGRMDDLSWTVTEFRRVSKEP